MKRWELRAASMSRMRCWRRRPSKFLILLVLVTLASAGVRAGLLAIPGVDMLAHGA